MEASLIEDLLIKEPDQKYICPICITLMIYPLQCVNGHVCCKDDWNKIISGTGVCSQCRIQVRENTLGKNIYLEDEIRNLQIRCPNNENKTGCSDIIKIDSLESHLKSCGFQLCACENSVKCGLIKRNQLEEHYLDCIYKVIVCECGDQITRGSKKQHQNTTCPVFLVNCTDCLASFERRELKDHSGQCPESLIDCIYSKYSCDSKVKRKDMQQHLNQVDHLVLVKNKSDDLEAIAEALTAQCKVLRVQLADLNSKKKFSSKWIIRNWSDKVKKFPQGQSISSQYFYYSSSKKFFLKVFPNGQDTSKLSVALYKGFDTKCKINFSIEIQNSIDTTKSLVQEETFIYAKGTSDYYTLVFYEDLNEDGLIVNNTLTIGFNINVEKIYSEHLITN